MQAFNNDPKFKIEVIENAKKHQKQDDYIRGTYYDEGLPGFKGCSVGCSISDINEIKDLDGKFGDHAFLAEQLGVPEFVTHLQDHFFENVSDDLLKTWTVDFFEAIPVGADLTSVLPKFLLFVVQDVKQFCDELTIKSVKDVETILQNWVETGSVDKKEAKAAAEAAARAADAAMAAEAAWSAEAAARTAARTVVWSAWSAARVAAWAAMATGAAARAARAAESSATDKYALKFLELMRETDHEQD